MFRGRFMKKVYMVQKVDNDLWPIKNVVTCFFLLMVLICFIMGFVKLKSNSTDPAWLTVDGFVLRPELETHMIEGQNRENANSIFYNACIHFQYIVDGNTYTGSYILGEMNKNDPARAQKTVAAYPQGKVIRIRYNPASPEQSVMDIPTKEKTLAFFLAGTIFLLCTFLTQRLIKDNTPMVTLPKKKSPSPRQTTNQKDENAPGIIPQASKLMSDISGRWTLDYQVPSMREIISSSHGVKTALGSDMKAVLSSGSETLTVTITMQEIEFKYKDAKSQGSCDILSDYHLDGNRLSLDHKSMDFLMTDIEDFPPRAYTYSRKGSKLILTSDEIEGLGKRKISYHLTRSMD